MDTKTAWQTLRDYAEGRIDHAWAERCPNTEYGHDIRDSDCPVCQALDAVQGCLAQIEEPAQPVLYVSADQLAGALPPEKPGSTTATVLLPVRKTPGGKFTQPLYAGAAPAAVAPFGYVNTQTGQFFTDVEPCRRGNEGHWRTVYLQPSAVAGAVATGWRLVPATPTREWIASVADGGYEDCDCASLIADILSRAPAAPALEAPAAPHLRQTRDKAGILHYLTPEQMAEEIVRLDARLAAAPQAPAAPSPYSADLLAALGQWHQRCEVMGAHHTLTEAQIAELVVAGLLRRAHGGQVITTAGRAALAAPAAPAVDAGALRDAEHYRFIKRHRLILSGGTEKYGWPIAPFGDECDRYIAKELAAERAAQAKEGGV